MTISLLAEKANALPLLPGVYLMRDENGTIIYIGKAKKLKNRVSSYFHGSHLPKVQAMVDKVDSFDTIIVKSEFEALLLENALIKQHKPHYNILLKDDKGYPFLAMDNSREYPTFSIVSKPDTTLSKVRYYGPYGGRSYTRDIIETILKALKLPSCNKKFPADFGKGRPCINYQLNLCDGWCRGDLTKEEYRRRIRQVQYILDGKSRELKEELTARMLEAADRLEFEKAASLRDTLKAIESLGEKKHMLEDDYSTDNENCFYKKEKYGEKLSAMLGIGNNISRIEAFDISNLGNSGICAAMTVFKDGKPIKRDYRRFRIKDLDSPDDYYSMHQVVHRRYSHYLKGDKGFDILPDLLLIDGGQGQVSSAEKALNELEINNLPVFGMVKDTKHRTRALVDSNGNEIGIKSEQMIFVLIGTIQEETHNTAITYQKKLREDEIGSDLTKVKGIGAKRAKDLLRQFKGMAGLKKASLDELKLVLPNAIAENLFEYLNNGEIT